MSSQQLVELTIAIKDPNMDDEERQKAIGKLLRHLRESDEVDLEEVALTENPDPKEGGKGFANLVGTLTAKVGIENIKKFLIFLGDRLADKPITVNVKVNDREIKIEVKSQHELLEAERVAKELLASMK